jgi:hypothetical protein
MTRSQSPFRRARAALLFCAVPALSTVFGLQARAQPAAAPCDTCETCTEALSRPSARVELVADLVASADGPCVVVRGAGAIFDGMERDLRAVGTKAAVGVRVEAPDALVKNLHVRGLATGIEVVSAPRATLFHNYVEATDVGVQVTASTDTRLHRNTILGGGAGVAFGARAAGQCAPGAKLASPGAVLNNNHIERAQAGVLACDAMPVLRNNTIVRNAVGLALASPEASAGPGGAGPYDACICAPGIPGLRAGDAILFSSGCSGCKVHEGWLPELTKLGHTVVLRPSGPENAAATATFDRYLNACIPQLTDTVGISGCVPNYGCLTNDLTFKVRRGNDAFERETQLNSQEEVAAYEKACQTIGARSYTAPGEACVVHAVHDNVLCENTEADVAAAGPNLWAKGADNACAKATGFTDAGAQGCARVCPASVETPAPPAARISSRAGGEQAPPAPPSAPPAPKGAAPTPPPAPAGPAAPPSTSSPAASASAPAPSAPVPTAAATAAAEPAAASGPGWAWIAAGLVLVVAIALGVWLRGAASAKRGDS